MTNKEDISEVDSVELKAGDYVVRRGWYEVAVFLGNDQFGNYVIRYANQAKPIFVNTKYPELTFRFATQDETWRAGIKGNLPSLTTCPKGPHDWQPAGFEESLKLESEKFSPLVETSQLTADEAQGFFQRW